MSKIINFNFHSLKERSIRDKLAPIMTRIEQARINEAIEEYLSTIWSQETQELMTADYGPDLTAQVRMIYQELMNCPVDWRTSTIDTALPIFQNIIANQYSWLSQKAKSKLNWAFIMTWK